MGKHFLLTREAKGAIAIFLLAGAWWVFEVVPIWVLQALFLIRLARDAFYGIHGAGRHVYLCIDYDRTRIYQNGVDLAPGIPNAGHRR